MTIQVDYVPDGWILFKDVEDEKKVVRPSKLGRTIGSTGVLPPSVMYFFDGDR